MRHLSKLFQKSIVYSNTDMNVYISIKKINKTQIEQIKSFMNSIDVDQNKDYVNLEIKENINHFEQDVSIRVQSIPDINKVLDYYVSK
jgi:hypothetical protein